MIEDQLGKDVERTEQVAPFGKIDQKAREYIQQAKAANTRKSYKKDLEDFVTWCQQYGIKPRPATSETVVRYLTDLADKGFKVSTIKRRVSAISQAHQAAGLDSPTHSLVVRSALAGIRRKLGVAEQGKAPLLTEDLRAMVNVLPHNLIGKRDAALLLLGFSGAFRRSELVGLDVDDLIFTCEGLRVVIRRSKTDQEGQGIEKGITYGYHLETCPVRAVESWLQASGITAGPVFRSINKHGRLQQGRLSDKAVALVVKRTVTDAGMDPSRYSGHSLRAGLATSAAQHGVEERVIMKQTGHRSTATVRKYIRMGSLFSENASAMVGL